MSSDTPNQAAPPRRMAGKSPNGAEKSKSKFSSIPNYLREELHLPDWLAGTVVVVAGGLILTLVVFVLILIFPVR